MKRKKKSASPKLSDVFGRFFMRHWKAFSVLGFCILWAVNLYLLPLNMAVLTTVFLTASIYLGLEGKRRSLWERAISFRLLELAKAYTQLSGKAEAKAEVTAEVKAAPAPPAQSYSQKSKRYDQIAINDDVVITDEKPAQMKRHLRPASRLSHSKNNRGVKTPIANAARVEATPAAKEVFYSDSLIKDFIQGGLEKQSLQIQQNPIVRMPGGDAYLFTLSAAVKTYAGTFLQADRYGDIAKKAKLHHRIDKAIVDAAMVMLADQSSKDMHYNIAIESDAFFDGTFMNGLIEKLRNERDLAQRIILSLPYHDFKQMPPRALQIMRGLGQLGCQFMVSNVDSLTPDIKLMQSAHVKSIMMPASFLVAMMNDRMHFREAIKARRHIEGSGLRMIVSGVDDQMTLDGLKDLAPRHLQGALFNKVTATKREAA